MIAEIQVLPTPAGTAGDRWAHVDAAIAAITASDIRYEVGPLGTSVEGGADTVWSVLRRAHEATLAAGATGVVTVIKVLDGDDTPSMRDLVGPHRPPEG